MKWRIVMDGESDFFQLTKAVADMPMIDESLMKMRAKTAAMRLNSYYLLDRYEAQLDGSVLVVFKGDEYHFR